ncbi:phage portal protein family protein, partial [Vibrio scophthalmi]
AIDTEKWIKNVGEMVDRGLVVAQTDIYERLKLKMPDDKTKAVLVPKDIASAVQPVTDAPQEVATNRRLALNRKDNEEDALPDQDEWGNIADALAAPIFDAVQQAQSYEELQAALDALSASNDDDSLTPLIESLTQATFSARLKGELNG